MRETILIVKLVEGFLAKKADKYISYSEKVESS